MAAVRKVLTMGVVLGLGVGFGSALFVLVTPGEQRTQEMLKEMPGQDAQRRAEAVKSKELLLATLQEAAATQENVTRRKNWMHGSGSSGRSA
ncbi:ubiquinol-cytochrome-c reductase complex assembly factor 3 [Loxodonta africana]|nr:ubiquinol-cytochrome-c reductase complex assembly factor 3 [Loxodonta africana]